ncbi:MAG: response regulator transcription factor [Bacilli bacterium]|jgi:two-component system alkaline phosphatase synthesis response regulator PhoP|nr:response regulator transcription factor [Bacilli bacterium]
MLPDIQGMDVLRMIRSEADSSQVQVIILSAKRMTADKVEGLDQGADDYIEKPFDILELASRVNARLRRREEETFYLFGPLKLDDKKHRFFFDEKEIALTSTEFSILKVLLAKQGEPVSREVLEKEAYAAEEIFESRSIDMHIASIRKKIGDSTGKIIHTVYGIGYQIG